MYSSSVHVCVIELLNGWTDFDDIVFVCLSGSLDNSDPQLDPVQPGEMLNMRF